MGTSIPYAPSIDWGISTAVSGGAGAIVTINLMLFYLLNVRAQVLYPGRFTSVGLGGGAGVRGASVANPSWTFFRTDVPLMIEDFAGFATMASGEFTPVLGGCVAYLTFWGVNHDPYWLDLGGVTVGASAGVNITLIGSVGFFDDPRRVIGAPITPS